jgi:hypothetical protein
MVCLILRGFIEINQAMSKQRRLKNHYYSIRFKRGNKPAPKGGGGEFLEIMNRDEHEENDRIKRESQENVQRSQTKTVVILIAGCVIFALIMMANKDPLAAGKSPAFASGLKLIFAEGVTLW